MEGKGRKAAIPHISALDGARGLAVAGVLLFHGGHLTGGYLGVDFFFTLSGFLITSLLLAESSRTGAIGLGGFWARRARRLLPALAVLMVGVALYSATLATPSELAQIRSDAFATLGYVANWHEIVSRQSYFALFSAPSPLNHTWSLAIEEQFYVIWPVVFVGLLAWWKRATPKAVLATALTLAAGSSVLMIALYTPTNTNRSYFGTDTRAAAILFGVALAAALAIHGPATKRNTRIALEGVGLAGALGLAIAWTRLDGQSATLYRGGFLLCGLAATAIIAAAIHPQSGPIARALSFRPLCGLGLISYGVYLYHWPIDIVLDSERTHLQGWPLILVQTLITIAIAIASYVIIEQPIRRGALTSRTLQRLAPAVAITLVIVLFAATARTPRTAQALVNSARTALASARLPRIGAAERAFKLAPPGSRRVLVIGDSVALLLAPELAALHTRPPLAVFDAGILGCKYVPFAVGPSGVVQARFHDVYVTHYTTAVPCTQDWEAAVVKRFRPDIVFWIVSNPVDAVRSPDEGWLATCSARYAALARHSLSDEVAVLGSTGARVILTTAVYPRYPFAAEDRATDCGNVIRRQVAAATGSQLVDMLQYVCPHRACRTKQNGVTLRPDGEHYIGQGATIVAKWLLDQVQ
ncbi:MAG TPA: acyltransferase family protein [Acidimicrobiia bacterium]